MCDRIAVNIMDNRCAIPPRTSKPHFVLPELFPTSVEQKTMDDRSAERPKCPPEPRRSFRLFCLGMMSLLCCLTEGRWWGEDEALLLRFTSCAPPALFQPPSAEPGISPGCNANAKLSIITSFNGYLWCRGKNTTSYMSKQSVKFGSTSSSRKDIENILDFTI